jgi:hypothetical protein
MDLNKYKKNIYSQTGEDGVIEELISILNKNGVSTSGSCVEFGAWDGVYCSNTFNLVKNYNFSAVYIEGSKKKFKKLTKTANKYKNIIPINKYVEIAGKNSLDSILQETDISDNFDLLSIDIDSYDCDAWKGLKKYSPKIVLMEIDNTIDPYKRVIGTGIGRNMGSSFKYALEIANEKRYTLLFDSGNLFFIRNDLLKYFDIKKEFVENPYLLFNSKWKGKSRYILFWHMSKIIPKSIYKFYLRYIKKLN